MGGASWGDAGEEVAARSRDADVPFLSGEEARTTTTTAFTQQLTLTPHIPTLSTFPLLLRSNIASATTPAPLSLFAALPSTYPVVYSPVPTIRTSAFVVVVVASGEDEAMIYFDVLTFDEAMISTIFELCGL